MTEPHPGDIEQTRHFIHSAIPPGLLPALRDIVPADSTDLPTFDRYEILGQLGQGGMSIVYRAMDRTLNREVAIKVLKGSAESHAGARRRFDREAQSTAKLQHPNLVAVYDAGEEAGRMFLVMELVRGGTLQGTSLGIDSAAAVVEKVARAVHAAHEQGIVHRDLKPANILMTESGEPKVADFGLAHLLDSDTALTRAGAAIGTPQYMSPEQVQGISVGPGTDIHALGAILFETLTGRPPYMAEGQAAIFARILNADPPTARSVNPRVPADLDTICLKALDKDPRRRYATALDFAEDLRRFRAGEPIAAKPATFASRTARRIRQRPATWATALLGSLIIAGMAATIWWQAKNSRPGPDLSAQISGAFLSLTSDTFQVMRDLEDHWHHPDSDASIQGQLAYIETRCEAAGRKYPDTRFPQSWRGLALFFAGQLGGLPMLEDAVRRAGEDPLPLVFLARVRMASYARAVRIPNSMRILDRTTAAPFTETPGMVKDREAARALMDEAVTRPIWERLERGKECLAYARAAGRLAEGRYRDAAELLTAMRDDPLLGSESGYLAGIAWQIAGEHRKAAEILEVVGRRGWFEALFQAGIAHQAQGLEKPDPRPDFERAIGAWDAALSKCRRHPETFIARGGIRSALAEGMRRRGEEAGPMFDLAMADMTDAVRLDPASEFAWLSRAHVRGLKSEAAPDPLPDLALAIEDMTQALKVNADSWIAYNNRASAQISVGTQSALRKIDPTPAFSQAILDADSALRIRPGFDAAHFNRASAHLGIGDWEAGQGREALASYQRAESDLTAILGLQADHWQARYNRTLIRMKIGHIAVNEPGWFEKVVADATECLNLKPDYGPAYKVRGNAHFELAGIEKRAGRSCTERYDLSIADQTNSIRCMPEDWQGYSNRGNGRAFRADSLPDSQEKIGGFEDAMRDYAEAIRLNPGNSQDHKMLAWVLLRLGRTEEARAALRAGLERLPQDPELRSFLEQLPRK